MSFDSAAYKKFFVTLTKFIPNYALYETQYELCTERSREKLASYDKSLHIAARKSRQVYFPCHKS